MATPMSREEPLRRVDAITTPEQMAQFLEESEPGKMALISHESGTPSYTNAQMIKELRSGSAAGRDYFKTVKHIVRTSIERDAEFGPPEP